MLGNKTNMVTIFRGDDTGGQLGKTIIITFRCDEGVQMTGVKVKFELGGFYTKEFTNVKDGDQLEIFLTHDETAKMPLGIMFGKLTGIDSSGKVRTFTNRIPIKVTNHVTEAYGDTEGIDVSVSNAVTWESISGKPETYPPSTHYHVINDVTGLQQALQEAGKVKTVNNNSPDANGNVSVPVPTSSDVESWGFLKKAWSDLTNAFAPIVHHHKYDDLDDKPTYATVATSGSYNDLINAPSLATVATSGNYEDLLNQPSFAAVATSGSYNDLGDKPSIPEPTPIATDLNTNNQAAESYMVGQALGGKLGTNDTAYDSNRLGGVEASQFPQKNSYGNITDGVDTASNITTTNKLTGNEILAYSGIDSYGNIAAEGDVTSSKGAYSLNAVASDVSTLKSGKVDKSGDTMTGPLTTTGLKLSKSTGAYLELVADYFRWVSSTGKELIKWVLPDQGGTIALTSNIPTDYTTDANVATGITTEGSALNQAVKQVAPTTDISGKLESASVADMFSTTKDYAVGDYCTYGGGMLYKCTTAKAAGSWDPSCFTLEQLIDNDAALALDDTTDELKIVDKNNNTLWSSKEVAMYDFNDSTSSPKANTITLFNVSASTIVWIPTVASGKVCDFIVDVKASADATENIVLSLDTDNYRYVHTNGLDMVADILTFEPGEIGRLTFTACAFTVDDRPTFQVTKIKFAVWEPESTTAEG